MRYLRSIDSFLGRWKQYAHFFVILHTTHITQTHIQSESRPNLRYWRVAWKSVVVAGCCWNHRQSHVAYCFALFAYLWCKTMQKKSNIFISSRFFVFLAFVSLSPRSFSLANDMLHIHGHVLCFVRKYFFSSPVTAAATARFSFSTIIASTRLVAAQFPHSLFYENDYYYCVLCAVVYIECCSVLYSCLIHITFLFRFSFIRD